MSLRLCVSDSSECRSGVIDANRSATISACAGPAGTIGPSIAFPTRRSFYDADQLDARVGAAKRTMELAWQLMCRVDLPDARGPKVRQSPMCSDQKESYAHRHPVSAVRRHGRLPIMWRFWDDPGCGSPRRPCKFTADFPSVPCMQRTKEMSSLSSAGKVIGRNRTIILQRFYGQPIVICAPRCGADGCWVFAPRKRRLIGQHRPGR